MDRYLCIPIALVLTLSLPVSTSAQLVMTTLNHDFGTLARADERFADFQIRNVGVKAEVIFRVEVPKSVEVKMSAKTIAPGATETIRLQYNPGAPGRFDIEAVVHTSAWMSPKRIWLRGESSFADTGTPCPDFSNTAGGMLRPFHISIRSGEMLPVPDAAVQVYRDGRLQGSTTTDANGEATMELPPGRYFVAASKGETAADTAVYTSSMRNHVLLMLNPTPELAAAYEAPRQAPVTPPPPALPQPPAEAGWPASRPAMAEPPAGDNPLMPLDLYKQSNVVFLVDVSTSMKQQGRLDLLKIAMTDLLDALRDVDRFTLISYASSTNVLVESAAGLDREACHAAIMGLTAAGSTEGAKAIDHAGRAARKHFLPEGNNQIILATDGAFNEGAANATKLVNKYRRQSIHTSVLCIRCGKFTTREMTALSEEGNGQFVPIESPSDAGERLLDEIKRSALRQ